MAALGFFAYSGTFKVRPSDHQEFGILPGLSGNVETRSVVLDGGEERQAAVPVERCRAL
jgi:hypothetical protein